VFLYCVVVLDLRYKFRFIRHRYTKIYEPDEAQHPVDEVKNTLVNQFYKGFSSNTSSSGQAAPSSSGGCSITMNPLLALANHMKESHKENHRSVEDWVRHQVEYPGLRLYRKT
jgi:hypothetical protein